MTIATPNAALSLRCCGGPGTGKPDPHNPLQRFCVGSSCMAWRRCDPNNEHSMGYCGLAGPPLEIEE